MALDPRRLGRTLPLLTVAIALTSIAFWWGLAAAADEDESTPPEAPVPTVDGSDVGNDASTADDPDPGKPKTGAVPQPERKKAEQTPAKSENLENLLSVEFERPFRRVRGKAGRFDVTVRVTNKTEEPVKGPVYLQITGSNFEDLSVLDSEYVARNGDPMFPLIEAGKSLSHRSRRGRTLKLSFETESKKDEERLGREADTDDASVRRRSRPVVSEQLASRGSDEPSEIDWQLTREGMQLAEKAEKTKIKKGRGRGTKNRSLPIPNDDPALTEAEEAMEKSAEEIMKIKGVEGIATSIDEHGNLVQIVFVKRLSLREKLPETIGGLPVVPELTWGFQTQQNPPANVPPNNRGQGGQPTFRQPPGACPTLPFCPTGSLQQRFPVLIPLGAQINNANELSVGTYGFLASDGASLFIGSNNHVMARTNRASPGEVINQNFLGGGNQIAQLTRFVTIDTSPGATNQVDAAIAQITTTTRFPVFVTPCRGYGAMTSNVLRARVGDAVSKCGRSTDCTNGTVFSVNFISNVCQNPPVCNVVARFTDQIAIRGTAGNFSAAGDSGSGIVNSVSNDPTGLLFAGGGGVTIANHMDVVLSSLGVRIVGAPQGCPTTPTPVPPGGPGDPGITP